MSFSMFSMNRGRLNPNRVRRFGGSISKTELHTDANAMSDPNGNEADATTGWTDVSLTGTGANVFDSDTWANLGITAGVGDYCIVANANDTPTDGARFYKDIGTDWSLVVGRTYLLTFNMRHVGAGIAWRGILNNTNTGATPTEIIITLLNTDTTFQSVSHYFTYTAAHTYLVFHENAGSFSGGVYLDNLSCREIFSTMGI